VSEQTSGIWWKLGLGLTALAGAGYALYRYVLSPLLKPIQSIGNVVGAALSSIGSVFQFTDTAWDTMVEGWNNLTGGCHFTLLQDSTAAGVQQALNTKQIGNVYWWHCPDEVVTCIVSWANALQLHFGVNTAVTWTQVVTTMNGEGFDVLLPEFKTRITAATGDPTGGFPDAGEHTSPAANFHYWEAMEGFKCIGVTITGQPTTAAITRYVVTWLWLKMFGYDPTPTFTTQNPGVGGFY